MDSKKDHLLTKKQAAEILGSSVRTIERMIAAGELIKIKIRGSVRLRYSQVMTFVEQGS